MNARLRDTLEQFCAHGPDGLLVALDFDGTLSPFVDDPMKARPLPAADASIRRLVGAGVAMALVSGRNITDLAERADPPAGTHLVGSHGAEQGQMLSAGLRAETFSLTETEQSTLIELARALREVVADRPGAWVQIKPSAAVVHTRQSSPEDAIAATTDAVATAVRFGLHAMRGKNVVEIAVVAASKGQALDALRRRLELAGGGPVLFAGDDTTDENAFEVLQPGDIGIKVGEGATAADFRVADPDELAQVLELLAERLSR